MPLNAAALPGFYEHLKASDLTGAAGTAVSLWTGSSGKAFSQGTVARQPVIGVDANGYKYVEFDGVDDMMLHVNANFGNNKPGGTMYALVQTASFPATSFDYFQFCSTADATLARMANRVNDGLPEAVGRRLDGDALQTAVGTVTWTNNVMHAITAWVDYTNSDGSTSVDGTEQTVSTTFSTNGSSSATNPALLSIGGRDGSAYMTGRVYELLFFEAAHTLADRSKVHSSFQDAYPAAITVTDYVAAGLVLLGTLATNGTLVRRPAHVRAGNISVTATLETFRSIVRDVAGSITAAGATANLYAKSAQGSIAAAATILRDLNHVRGGSITSGGVLARGVTAMRGGTVAPAGVASTTFLGRVFGRPGIVALRTRTLGILRLRVRRPN